MIKIIQTADPIKYAEMLKYTSGINRLYAYIHHHDFESYCGLKRGVAPVHAAYNRAYMLDEVINSGYRGWVLYLDADAYFNDLVFDVEDYLSRNSDFSFIAAEAGAHLSQKWAINNGIFFVNLGTPEGVWICNNLKTLIDANVPNQYWDDPEADWAPAEFDDQNLLYGVLAFDQRVLEKVKKESADVFNYNGTFIRQAIRASADTFETILKNVRKECLRVKNDFQSKIDEAFFS